MSEGELAGQGQVEERAEGAECSNARWRQMGSGEKGRKVASTASALATPASTCSNIEDPADASFESNDSSFLQESAGATSPESSRSAQACPPLRLAALGATEPACSVRGPPEEELRVGREGGVEEQEPRDDEGYDTDDQESVQSARCAIAVACRWMRFAGLPSWISLRCRGQAAGPSWQREEEEEERPQPQKARPSSAPPLPAPPERLALQGLQFRTHCKHWCDCGDCAKRLAGHGGFGVAELTFSLGDIHSQGAGVGFTGGDAKSSLPAAGDWEWVLRSLLLQRGLLEDLEVPAAPNSAPSSAPPPRRRDGLRRPPREGSEGHLPTLRELRQLEPFRRLSQEAQTTLLSGALYKYGDPAGKRRPAPLESASPRSSSAGSAQPGLGGVVEASEEEKEEEREEEEREEEGAVLDVGSTASSAAASSTASAAGGDAAGPRSAPPVVRYQLQLDAVAIDESLARSARRVTGRGAAASTARSAAPSVQRSALSLDSARTVSAQTSDSGSEESEGEQEAVDARQGEEERRPSEHYRLALENLAREAIDEGLARGARRVLEQACAVAGRAISREELHALPQVCFENAEEQSCSICLEAYRREELLTALGCGHFFHLQCLTGWFQQTNRCPLCRSPCLA